MRINLLLSAQNILEYASVKQFHSDLLVKLSVTHLKEKSVRILGIKQNQS